VGARFSFTEGFSASVEYAAGLVAAPGQRGPPNKIYVEFSYRF
jgi:hemolysin activation/secretion protein